MPLRRDMHPVALAAALLFAFASVTPARQDPAQDGRPRFRSGIELINVTATVTDRDGRFVAGLRKDDFRVYQDEEPQEITHFTSDRVPVSLGILLDTSSSMDEPKMRAAREALNRFLLDLLGPQDEVFLYRFDSSPELVHGWTADKRKVSDALETIQPGGGTVLFDAIAEAIPLVQSGRHEKKALVIISDGQDTLSRILLEQLKTQIRATEILIYAIGIDEQVPTDLPIPRNPWRGSLTGFEQSRPRPFPFPRPGRPGGLPPRPLPPTNPTPRFPPATPPIVPPTAPPRSPGRGQPPEDRVNSVVLREITDASGGRTEIVRSARDLREATASIADELSRQYQLAYHSSAPPDGRWHSIRVEVGDGAYHVRARTGFVSQPSNR